MPVNFEKLRIGGEYERKELAKLWGYRGIQAIQRGVITPSGTNFIILFVTKIKQDSLTQYNDYLLGDILHWEGEERHGSDERVIDASSFNDEIHLFYREIHHTPFVYYGRIRLQKYTRKITEPSEFIFILENDPETTDPFEDIENHKNEFLILDKTEQEAIVKSRIGQGIFRDRLIELWCGCSVSGLSNQALLRASHIKPWRDCTNEERLDPKNGLLLHPVLDHLFDAGYNTFGPDGKIIFSKRLTEDEISTLGLDPDWELRRMPFGIEEYLRYHTENVFK